MFSFLFSLSDSMTDPNSDTQSLKHSVNQEPKSHRLRYSGTLRLIFAGVLFLIPGCATAATANNFVKTVK